jgi:hypothetical protein
MSQWLVRLPLNWTPGLRWDDGSRMNGTAAKLEHRPGALKPGICVSRRED